MLTLDGDGVERMDHESGGHRVQRVPQGERNGRVHSSTVTVAVLDPRAPPTSLDRYPAHEFAVSFFSGTGPGGQNRNKVQACARVVHLPTGRTRTAQTRSRDNSTRLAMAALLEDLQTAQAQAEQARTDRERRAQMGSGERGDKRRTYRCQEDQVLDHRSGRRARASSVLDGHLEPLWGLAGA